MMEPVRVLHLITSLTTGGTELALLRLLERMDPKKFKTLVVCMIPLGAVGETMLQKGIPVIALSMPPGRPTLGGLRHLLTIIREFRPHILQTWLYHADLLGLVGARLGSVPILYWNIRTAEADFSQLRLLSQLIIRTCAFLSPQPNGVIVNARAGQTTHTRFGYRPNRWVYIPNGIDTNHFAPDIQSGQALRGHWHVPTDAFLVGLVGRFDIQKDHSTFLRAASIVHARSPRVYFVCVGDGPTEYGQKLKTLATKLGLNNLIWAGARKDMPVVYNALDLLVSTSTVEGFPNVVAEAMACERPCLVTDVGDSGYLLADCGESLPASDPRALADAILRMLARSIDERANFGRKARQRIQENFNLDMMIQAYTVLYEQAAIQAQPAPFPSERP